MKAKMTSFYFALWTGLFLVASTLPTELCAEEEDNPPERSLVPEAAVEVPEGAKAETGDPSDGKNAQDPPVSDSHATDSAEEPFAEPASSAHLPSVEKTEIVLHDCRALLDGGSEAIMEAIVMVESGPDSKFCRLGAGEVCSDFESKIKEFGSLKASNQGGAFCQFIGH